MTHSGIRKSSVSISDWKQRLFGRRGRRVERRVQRITLANSAIILLTGGIAGAVKLYSRDVERIERVTGKPAEQMTPEELYAAMQFLDVCRIALEDEDIELIEAAEKRK